MMMKQILKMLLGFIVPKKFQPRLRLIYDKLILIYDRYFYSYLLCTKYRSEKLSETVSKEVSKFKYLFQDNQSCKLKIQDAESYKRRAPNLINYHNFYDVLSKNFLRRCDSFFSSKSQSVSEIYLYHLRKVTVFKEGVIGNEKNQLFKETLHLVVPSDAGFLTDADKRLRKFFFFDEDETVNFISLPKDEYLTGSEKKVFYRKSEKGKRITKGTVVLLRKQGDYNYAHWITELLPIVAILNEITDITKLKFYVPKSSKSMRRIYFESLMLFSVKKENIIETDNNPTYFESLLYLSPISKHPFWKSPLAIQKLRELTDLNEPYKKFPEKIFVSREDAKQRSLINEKNVFERLKTRDFSFIRSSDYSFREQILIFRNAKVIVGVAGAAMANIVFSKPKTKILTLVPDYTPGWFSWDLACMLNLEYYTLHGKSTEVKIPKDKQRWTGAKDFIIDIEEFDKAIDLIMSQ